MHSGECAYFLNSVNGKEEWETLFVQSKDERFLARGQDVYVSEKVRILCRRKTELIEKTLSIAKFLSRSRTHKGGSNFKILRRKYDNDSTGKDTGLA
ncbi:hypothetical protein A0128_11795 [Leptospira tipperaryensis]|uniref:Uncharacterized protein n=1 Tax=Leptospira tipperaryensis TaxID=2564040 RepID=A0A1D7UY30_9LEPT|nr:hypothetical protein A0128_11795 [Leptospira tipperaryensis]